MVLVYHEVQVALVVHGHHLYQVVHSIHLIHLGQSVQKIQELRQVLIFPFLLLIHSFHQIRVVLGALVLQSNQLVLVNLGFLEDQEVRLILGPLVLPFHH